MMIIPSVVIIIAYAYVHEDTGSSFQTRKMAQSVGESLGVTTWSLLNNDTALALVA